MAKEDFIQAEGVVTESLPNAMFRVEVEGQQELLLCHLSGKMRKHFIKVLPGDRVIFEMSPYDLSKGRITRRLKPGEGLQQQADALAAEQAAAAGTPVATEQSPEAANPTPEPTTPTENQESNNASQTIS